MSRIIKNVVIDSLPQGFHLLSSVLVEDSSWNLICKQLSEKPNQLQDKRMRT